jgi:Domain of unknown function (DUF4476)
MNQIMKTILSFALTLFSMASFAQGINITFTGSRAGQKYHVVLDGASYYSANATNSSTNASGRTTISLDDITPGSHTIDVYRMESNSTLYPNGTRNAPTVGESIYSKTFTTRINYDMNITVRDNVSVSFTESKAVQKPATLPQGTNGAMSSSSFTSLYNKIKTQRYQSQKISMIQSAFNTRANAFTSSQVKQLIALVSSEKSRFDLAKLSYNKVVDKNEFITVYDVLQSEAMRDSLDDYVVSQGGVSSESAPPPQSSPSKTLMSSYNFDQAYQRLQNLSYQGDRVNEMRNLLTGAGNYFSTAQLKRLLALVTNETDRLSMAKTAWPRAYEPSTFNQLVDLFYEQSNRDALNSFIISNGGMANNSSYKAAMSEETYSDIYNKAKNHFLPWNVTNDVKAAFNNTNYNFSTTQVRGLLLLIAAESDRLEAAKLAYPRTVDKVNFMQLADLFTTEANRAEFNRFVNSQ